MDEHEDAGYFRARLRYDGSTGKLYWRRWDAAPKNWNTRYAGREAGTIDNRVECGRVYPQVRIGIDGKLYLGSRIVWLICMGEWPDQDLDHINGDRLNNRFRNLLDVTHQVNTAKRHDRRKR